MNYDSNDNSRNDNTRNDNSRNDLMDWVNDIIKSNLTKIEQLGSGVVYCQLFEHVHPGKSTQQNIIKVSKFNVKAKTEYDYVQNFKVLQSCFTKLNIIKPIEIEKLIKCKYQDNLEFLQWIKRYFEQNYNDLTDKSRGSSKPRLPPKVIKTEPASFMMSKNASSSSLSVVDQDCQRHRIDIRAELQGQIDTMKTEKDYSFSKLKDIDQVLDESESLSKDDIISKIRRILYQTQDKFISVMEDGRIEIKN